MTTPDGTQAEFVAGAIRARASRARREADRSERRGVQVLVKLAGQHSAVPAVGHEKRFRPNSARVRSMMADGVIREPFHCGGSTGPAQPNLTPSSPRKGSSKCPCFRNGTPSCPAAWARLGAFTGKPQSMLPLAALARQVRSFAVGAWGTVGRSRWRYDSPSMTSFRSRVSGSANIASHSTGSRLR